MTNLLAKFFRWALLGNYPSGSDPWSGTSLTVAPAYEHFTPGVPPSAQEMNSDLNLLGEEAKLIATVPMGSAFSQVPSVIAPGSTSIDYLSYDTDGALWLAACNATAELAASWDNGQSWATLATPVGQILALGNFTIPGNIMPTDAILILGGSNHVFYYTAATGTLVDSGGTQGVTACGGGAAFGLQTSTPAVFGFTYDQSNQRTRAFVSAGPASFASLTLPTAWQNGPQVNITHFSYGVGVQFDALIAWGGGTPGVNTSYILRANIGPVWPGTPTFTDLSLPSGMSTKSIVGVAYNTTTAQWGAMVWDGVNSALWTTADLTTWTQQANMPGQFAGLVTVGPYWVSSQPHLGHPNANGYMPVYSLDGQAWARAAGMITNTASRMAQAKGGYALWTSGIAIFSPRIG